MISLDLSSFPDLLPTVIAARNYTSIHTRISHTYRHTYVSAYSPVARHTTEDACPSRPADDSCPASHALFDSYPAIHGAQWSHVARPAETEAVQVTQCSGCSAKSGWREGVLLRVRAGEKSFWFESAYVSIRQHANTHTHIYIYIHTHTQAHTFCCAAVGEKAVDEGKAFCSRGEIEETGICLAREAEACLTDKVFWVWGHIYSN